MGGVAGIEGAEASIRRYTNQLQYCYEKQLKVHPTLQGRLELGWSIHAGRVADATILADSLGDAELAGCVVQKVRRWSFAPEGDGAVRWTFEFSSSEKGGGR